MLQPKKEHFNYLKPESYLAFINNSVGTKMFRSYFVEKNGQKVDVLNKGRLSCAAYASAVLSWFNLVKSPHFTVARTVDDLLSCGAKKISLSRARPGDVLVWVPEKNQRDPHNHIGFYLGGVSAVSNSQKKGMIVKHHYTFKGTRAVELVLRPDWNNSNA